MNKLKAVIFDVDGTLIDTELVQSDAYRKVLKDNGHHEIKLTKHGTVHVPGESTAETWTRLKEVHELSHDIETLTAHKRSAAMQALQTELSPLPGVVNLVKELHEKGVKLAVASSALRERIELILKGLSMFQYFDAIISAEDVDKVKPAPDPYLAAAQKLQVEPAECVVVEDTDVGMQSAIAAGIGVLIVPNNYTRTMDFSGANLVVGSLENVGYQDFVQIIKQ